MQRKKNRFWLFIFSFMPGAGEMYMGFMRMGLSLMLGFLILAGVVGLTNIGVLGIFPFALYIYSFFHANNLASLDDATFYNMEDRFLFGFEYVGQRQIRLEGKHRKIAALVLIALGTIMLWQVAFNLLCDIFGWDNRLLSAIYYFVRDELPRAIIGIAVIWIGFALIRGKRPAIEEREPEMDGEYDDRERWGYREPDYSTPFTENGRPDYREPYTESGRADYREPYAESGGSDYREPYTENNRSDYMGNFTGNNGSEDRNMSADEERRFHGQQSAADDRTPYKKAAPVVDEYRQPHENTTVGWQAAGRDSTAVKERPGSMQSGMQGNIIYAEGPVADGMHNGEHTRQNG